MWVTMEDEEALGPSTPVQHVRWGNEKCGYLEWDCLGLPGAQKITQLARKREYKHALGCYRYRHVFTPQFWNQPDVLFGSTAGSLGA